VVQVPTVKIKNPSNPKDYVIINESDYDEDVHELWDSKKSPKKAPSTPPSDEGTESGEASSLTVDFASRAAADLAQEQELTDADFEGVETSGKTGYTKSDVETLVAEKNG